MKEKIQQILPCYGWHAKIGNARCRVVVWALTQGGEFGGIGAHPTSGKLVILDSEPDFAGYEYLSKDSLRKQDAKLHDADDDLGDERRHRITEAQLRSCFKDKSELSRKQLVEKLVETSGSGESTCWRVTGDRGYLRGLLRKTNRGTFVLEPSL
jgi:hypothetical protein